MEFIDLINRVLDEGIMGVILFSLIVVVIGGFLYIRMHTNSQNRILKSFTEMVSANRDLLNSTILQAFKLNDDIRELNKQLAHHETLLRQSEVRQNELEEERTLLLAERTKERKIMYRLYQKTLADGKRIQSLEADLEETKSSLTKAQAEIIELRERLRQYETGELDQGIVQ